MNAPLSLDRAWLRAHPGANYRLRDPAPGEIETILRRTVRAAGAELDAGHSLPENEGMKYRIVVIAVSPDTLVRMIIVSTIEDERETANEFTFSAMAVAFGDRIALDRVGG